MKRGAIALGLVALLVTPPVEAAPGNDAFANATPVAAVPFTAPVDLTEATREPGEPMDCNAVRRSVWYSFTPAEESDLLIEASNGQQGTYGAVAVFTGETLASLQMIGCDTFGISSADIRVTARAGSAVWIQVAAGLDGTNSATVTIEPLSRISGTVTAQDGTPLQGICVRSTFTTSEYLTGYTETAADGTYAIKRQDAGPRKIQFSSCKDHRYVTEYWNDQPTFASATVVTVPAGGTLSGIDATLARGSRIVGTLTDRRNKPAFSCIEARTQAGEIVSSGSGSFSGAYALGVPPGTYMVRVGGCNLYEAEYHPDASTIDDAVAVDVPPMSDVTVDATIEPGGTISGRVTDAGASPVSECVEAFTPSGTLVRTASGSSITGEYDLRGLPTGSYRLRFAGCTWTSGNGLPVWYGGSSLETAAPVDVVYGSDVTGIDGVVTAGTSISGRITDAEGFPVAFECVGLYTSGGAAIRTLRADDKGNYKASRVSDGSYKLRFGGCTRDLRSEWYADAPDAPSATAVTATAASPATGIDAELAFRLPPANDALGSAIAVPALPFTDTRDVMMATMEPGEPSACGGSTMRSSIWYRHTSPELRLMTASTDGTVDVDTIIAVYVQGPNGLIQIACIDATDSLIGENLQFLALPGVEMFIQVSGSASWPPSYSGIVKFGLR